MRQNDAEEVGRRSGRRQQGAPEGPALPLADEDRDRAAEAAEEQGGPDEDSRRGCIEGPHQLVVRSVDQPEQQQHQGGKDNPEHHRAAGAAHLDQDPLGHGHDLTQALTHRLPLTVAALPVDERLPTDRGGVLVSPTKGQRTSTNGSVRAIGGHPRLVGVRRLGCRSYGWIVAATALVCSVVLSGAIVMLCSALPGWSSRKRLGIGALFAIVVLGGGLGFAWIYRPGVQP